MATPELKAKEWKKIPQPQFMKVQELLLSKGGKEILGKSEKASLEWIVQVGKAKFALYSNGTLFNYPIYDDRLDELREAISELVGYAYPLPIRDFLIGLDETGAGEILGNLVLACVRCPSYLQQRVEEILGVADTKNKRSYDYWKKLYSQIKPLEDDGLIISFESISPLQLHKGLHLLRDEIFPVMIRKLMDGVPVDKCVITVDNYGIGKSFESYLEELRSKGCAVRVEFKADDTYLEAKLASVISKYERMRSLDEANILYGFSDCPLGSGHPEDPVTRGWINRWKLTGKSWPNFVRTEYLKDNTEYFSASSLNS